jgi:hypothetical protein
VENASAVPFAFNYETNAFVVIGPQPLLVGWYAAAVVGKLLDQVLPVTYAFPLASTTMSLSESCPSPPSKVEYTNAVPASFTFTMKPSPYQPECCGCTTPGVVGKYVELETPPTYALPAASTATAWPTSEPLY